jgi:enamine deaminase RidA (YjgF/YER057c/UK114 family)
MPITHLVLDDLFASPVVPHAVTHDGTVYISGVLGTLDATGALADDAEEEFRAVLSNLFAVLAAAGSNPSHLLQLSVHLSSLDLLPLFNQVYAELLPLERPARATVQSGLFGACRVEIAAIATLVES